jgi:regulatory protein
VHTASAESLQQKASSPLTEKVVSILALPGGRVRVELPSGLFVVPRKSAPGPEDEVSTEAISRIQMHSAMVAAQRYMAASERSTGQLARKLMGMGYSEETTDEVVARSLEYGYVNDMRYALMFMRSRSMGPFRLRYELMERGVGEKAIEEALKGFNHEDIFERVVAEVRRRYGGMEDSEKAARRATGWLSRRGFEAEFTRRVLRAAL